MQDSHYTMRIAWIDIIRGICMLLILWFHTEVYFVGTEIIPYHLYVADALCCFYFLSGYLFFTNNTFDLRHKLKSIIKNIVTPYFFFTLLLAVPKSLANDIPVSNILINIICGNASWFVTSLIVAELLFSFLLYVNKQWLIHIVAPLSLIASWLLTGTNIAVNYNFWNFHNALIGLFFLYLGYEYHRHETFFQRFNSHYISFILLIVLIAIKTYIYNNDVSLLIEPVCISNYFVFLIDTIVFILFLITINYQLSNFNSIQWVGRHSLVYYFFCGAVPMAVSKTLFAVNINYTAYWQIPLVFIIVVIISSIIVWLCYRCLPFLKR